MRTVGPKEQAMRDLREKQMKEQEEAAGKKPARKKKEKPAKKKIKEMKKWRKKGTPPVDSRAGGMLDRRELLSPGS